MTVATLTIASAAGAAVGQDTAAPRISLYAAGSLRAVMTDLVRAFGEGSVMPTFGPSGLLRERIERGERADVFTSADLDHPDRLAAGGRWSPTVPFVRNRLCAIAAPGLEITPATLLERLLDPGIRLGTSTPKADPSGDYAWEMFRKADALRPGTGTTLAKKALQLVGGPDSPPVPAGRNAYAMLIADGKADVFLSYCTNGRTVVGEVPGARMIDLPPALAVGATYGLTVRADAPAAAFRFALFVLSAQGQEALARRGFTPLAGP